MEYKVVTSTSASGLTTKINEAVAEGWKVEKRSYNVVERNHQLRYSGSQHRDTQIESQYSVLMKKKL